MRLIGMWVLFLSSVVCSFALHLNQESDGARKPWQAVLVLGCSVDRYAVQDVYGKPPVRHSNNWRVVYDRDHKMSLLYMFHRGVGINGDMRPPFYVSQNQVDNMNISTEDVISDMAPRFTKAYMSTAQPDLVVVDSSLWDLSGWNQVNDSYRQSNRVEQWCNDDLPAMLKLIRTTFKSSRIVFRTAPALAPGTSRKSCRTGVEVMYQCIVSNTNEEGKLFGQYEVLDYHKIVADLVAELPAGVGKVEDLWREDGYHPGPVAGKLYIQKIIELASPSQARLSDPSGPPPPAPVDRAGVEPRANNGGDDPLAAWAYDGNDDPFAAG